MKALKISCRLVGIVHRVGCTPKNGQIELREMSTVGETEVLKIGC